MRAPRAVEQKTEVGVCVWALWYESEGGKEGRGKLRTKREGRARVLELEAVHDDGLEVALRLGGALERRELLRARAHRNIEI